MTIRSWLTKIAIASTVVVGALSTVPATAFAGTGVGFTDPNQAGSLTLCNQHGQAVTSGSVLTVPFVWRAVSSVRAPAGYTRATLVLFQPIQYEDPGDWTGYQLTDDAIFSNPAHPMAQATYADAPLIWPDQSMPPYWDGLYQLRMVFSAPNKIPWVSPYPAAVVKVSGNHWMLLQGGGSSCGGGTAVSVASLQLPKSETAVPKPPAKVSSGKNGKGGSSSTGSTQGSGQASGGSSSPTDGTSPGSASADAAGNAHQSGGSGAPAGVIAGGVVAALVLAGLATALVFRRRRRAA